MVMAQELYALLTLTAFHFPNNPGEAVGYTRATMAGQPVDNTPLTRTEQSTINTCFSREKHYYLSMRNIERACFTPLNASVNDAFKVSNDPTIQGWQAGMHVIDILHQLSTIYGQQTPAAHKMNDAVFRSPYLAANAPEVLFCCIKECAETALLGRNPYTDCQLIMNAIRQLLTTGLYSRPFKEWYHLLPTGQTWIALQTIIQEAIQPCLNAMAPIASITGMPPLYLIKMHLEH
jgi:hypothetical protein